MNLLVDTYGRIRKVRKDFGVAIVINTAMWVAIISAFRAVLR